VGVWGRVKTEGETTKLGGNHSPSLEIPGHILQVLEGKPWVRERTDLLPRALGMTNFPFNLQTDLGPLSYQI